MIMIGDNITKQCTECNIFVQIENIGKKSSKCKDCLNRIYREKYLLNKEKYIETRKNWRKNNILKLREYRNNYNKNRKKQDSLYKLKCNLRSLISISFKNNNLPKNSKLLDILQCDFIFFKEYIENQFKENMNWNNIHLDHIKPISLAKSEKEIIELNHYTNFQPLLKIDNLRKSNKIIEKQLKLL